MASKEAIKAMEEIHRALCHPGCTLQECVSSIAICADLIDAAFAERIGRYERLREAVLKFRESDTDTEQASAWDAMVKALEKTDGPI